MKKQLLINVDTEAHRGTNPVEDLIYGKVCGGEYGINKIMDICEKYNVYATFFVDFAEVNTWGYEKIKEVCDDIILRGHDIQLHLHPEHFGDWQRQEFSQYTYDEQKKMIEYGINQYKSMLGHKPLAFRAGKYSINEDTIKALREMEIKIDSSFVKNNRWCKLNGRRTDANVISEYNGIYEIPVTVFKERIFNKQPLDKYYVFDVNTMTKFEFKELYAKFVKSNIKTVTFFMHSFSFLKRYNDDLNLKPNKSDIKFFDFILKYVTERKDFKVITYSEYWERIECQSLKEDFVPIINSFIKSAIGIFIRYKKASIRSKQFRKYIYAIYAVAVTSLSLLLYLFYYLFF